MRATFHILTGLVAVLLWLSPLPALAASQFAVLVGVGKYHPDSVRSANERLDLKSPPNDLALMQDLLAHYGFRQQDMKILVDEQATRDDITRTVANRLLKLPPGSLAVFYFSGHGSAVRGATADEDTDETIVPYDGRIKGQPVRDILDDEIYGWITELTRKGIRAVFILDSCLSGGAARAGLEAKRLAPAFSGASAPATDRKLSLRNELGFDRAAPAVVVTASKVDENAYGQMEDNSPLSYGVFTRALHRLLLPSQASVPPKIWSAVVDALTVQLKPEISGTPQQTPQLFGLRTAPVFGSGQPSSHAIKARSRPGSVELDAGALTGITEGSVFKLFGLDHIPWRTSEEFQAKAKVSRVFDRSATLDVIEGTLASEELYAVEFEYALPDVRLKLAVAPGTGLSATDKPALSGALSGLGEIVAAGVAPDLVLTPAAGGQLQLVTAGGQPVGVPLDLAGAAAMRADLRDRLGDYSRWQRVLGWKRVGVRPSGLKLALEFQAAGGEPVTLQDGLLDQAQIPAGASVKLRVRNFGLQRVQVDALLLRQDFTVDYCPLGIVERNARSTTESVTLASSAGLAAFKLIVSDPQQAVDFSYLHSSVVRRAPRSGPEQDLAGIWRGTARATRRGPGGATFEWQTLDIPFTVTAAAPGAMKEAVTRCRMIPQ